MSAMQSSSHAFSFQMLDRNGLRPKGLGRVTEESGEHTVFITFYVDLERVDASDAGILQDRQQTMCRYFETAGGRDVTGTEILAISLDHQLAVDVAGGGADEGQVLQI